MKTIFTFIVLTFTLCAFSQHFGSYRVETEGTYNSNEPVYEVWLRSEGYVTMKFRQTPMGLKHLYETAEQIVDENGMMDDDPAFDESTIGSDVDYTDNYEQVNSSILSGNSELRVGYRKDAQLFQIFAASDGYELNIIGAYN